MIFRRTSAVAVMALSLAVAPFAVQQAEAAPVGLELVLAIDVSGSVSGAEYNLQRQGYVNAFESASVQSAIAGIAGGVAVTVVQWASNATQSTAWYELTDAASVSAFALVLAGMNRATGIGSNTGIGNAINFSANLLDTNAYEGARSVIDVSGDGTNNTGPAPAGARDAAVANGHVINGLPILTDVSNLDTYYTDNVIGGDKAFMIAANDFADFAKAIEQKLYREISGNPVPEPATLAIFGLGLAGLGVVVRRRRQV